MNCISAIYLQLIGVTVTQTLRYKLNSNISNSWFIWYFDNIWQPPCEPNVLEQIRDSMSSNFCHWVQLQQQHHTNMHAVAYLGPNVSSIPIITWNVESGKLQSRIVNEWYHRKVLARQSLCGRQPSFTMIWPDQSKIRDQSEHLKLRCRVVSMPWRWVLIQLIGSKWPCLTVLFEKPVLHRIESQFEFEVFDLNILRAGTLTSHEFLDVIIISGVCPARRPTACPLKLFQQFFRQNALVLHHVQMQEEDTWKGKMKDERCCLVSQIQKCHTWISDIRNQKWRCSPLSISPQIILRCH